jgi:hypothetical protein
MLLSYAGKTACVVVIVRPGAPNIAYGLSSDHIGFSNSHQQYE